MDRCRDGRHPRTRGVVRVLAVVLAVGAAEGLGAQDAALTPYGPPPVPSIFVPVDGRVTLSLPSDDAGAGEGEVRVTILPFRTAAAEMVLLTFHEDMNVAGRTEATIRRTDPVILDASAVPVGGEAWGYLSVGGTTLPLRLDRGAPRLLRTPSVADTVRLTAEGVGRMRLDVSGHRQDGSAGTFSVLDFEPVEGSGLLPVFLSPTDPGGCSPPRAAATGSRVLLPLNTDAVTLCVRADDARPGVDYRGGIEAAIGDQRFVVDLTLRRDAYGTTSSIVQPPPLVVRQTCWLRLLGCVPQPVRFDLRAEARAVGLSARLSSAPTPEFNPLGDLKLSLLMPADSVAGNLWLVDPTNAEEVRRRTIDGGSQAQLVVEFVEPLPPGDHTATFEVHTLNGDPEAPAELTLTANVRVAPIWPLFVLVVAVMASFVGTKGVIALRERRDLRRRARAIHASRGLWVTGWNVPPIVKAEAEVALVEEMLDRERGLAKSVLVPQMQASRIEKIEAALPRLRRLTRLASYWLLIPRDGVVSNDDAMVIRRAQKCLRGIVADFDDETRAATVDAEITALEDWEKAAETRQRYWEDLRPDIERLVSSVRIGTVPVADREELKSAIEAWIEALKKANHAAEAKELEVATAGLAKVDVDGASPIREIVDRVAAKTDVNAGVESALTKIETCDAEVVRTLVNRLHPETEPATIALAIEQEEVYAKLKLIWEQRDNLDLREKLYALARSGEEVESFFYVTDRWTWERLRETPGNGGAATAAAGIVRTSRHAHGDPEAYELISFEVRPKQPDADNYLFKHGIEYRWSIAGVDLHPLTPTTREPRVTQFIPKAAEAQVSVEMHWAGGALAVPPLLLRVEPSQKATLLSAYQRPEILAAMVVLIAAIVSGTQTEAFESALAGSLWDTGKVFAWGVGADQLKNLLQAMRIGPAGS